MWRSASARIVSRVLAGVVGSWVFVFGLVSVGILALLRAGMAYDDARTLMHLIGVLVLLAALLWTFAAARVGRVWLVLCGGGVLMCAAAWWLARAGA